MRQIVVGCCLLADNKQNTAAAFFVLFYIIKTLVHTDLLSHAALDCKQHITLKLLAKLQDDRQGDFHPSELSGQGMFLSPIA